MTSPHMIRRRMAATTPLVLALLLLAFVLVALSLGDRAIARMAAETLIRVTLVVGFWIFVGSLIVIAAAWVAARPLVLAPIARLFGKVSGR